MPAISFLPFLQTVPLGTRLLTLTLLIGTMGALLISILIARSSPTGKPASEVPGLEMPWLVMVPGESWKYPWVLLTAGWIELSLFEVLFSVVTLPLACRYLERIWGFRELIRFCFIVIIGSNIIAFGFSWLMYIVLGQEEALWGLPYHGLSGLQVGFLVAFTQLIPEHQVQIFGKLKLRVKTLPGIYLLLSNIAVIVLGSSPYMLIQFGFFVAWAYLRFFKASEDGSRGDRSETFAFQYWFPPPVRPYIAAAGNVVYKQAVRVGLVQAWDEPSQGGSYGMLPGPGGARAEAERRRAMALKALDARLASGSPAPAAPAASTTTTTSEEVPEILAPPPALTSNASTRSVTQVPVPEEVAAAEKPE